MGRFSVNRSREHNCEWVGFDTYEISWVYDRYYAGSRLRFPRGMKRITDTRGAIKFCKRWKLEPPRRLSGE
jgi:hypothetical protein